MEQATTLVPSVTCKTSTARCKVCPVFHVNLDFSLKYVEVSEFNFGLACRRSTWGSRQSPSHRQCSSHEQAGPATIQVHSQMTLRVTMQEHRVLATAHIHIGSEFVGGALGIMLCEAITWLM